MWFRESFFEQIVYKPHKTIYTKAVNNKKQRIVKNKQHKTTKMEDIYYENSGI